MAFAYKAEKSRRQYERASDPRPLTLSKRSSRTPAPTTERPILIGARYRRYTAIKPSRTPRRPSVGVQYLWPVYGIDHRPVALADALRNRRRWGAWPRRRPPASAARARGGAARAVDRAGRTRVKLHGRPGHLARALLPSPVQIGPRDDRADQRSWPRWLAEVVQAFDNRLDGRPCRAAGLAP